MLINIAEPIPKEFFVFVDQTNFITAHNLKETKIFSSAAFTHWSDKFFATKYEHGEIDYLPYCINPNKNIQTVSPFENTITSEYTTEYNLEVFRKHYYSKFPSRLSSVYAFGDFATCEQVSMKYHWQLSSVKKFSLIPNPLNRIAKVNMEIVSLCRYATRVSMTDSETNEKIWNSYWTGQGDIQLELPTVNGRKTFKSGIIWEYLIEGQLKLLA